MWFKGVRSRIYASFRLTRVLGSLVSAGIDFALDALLHVPS